MSLSKFAKAHPKVGNSDPEFCSLPFAREAERRGIIARSFMSVTGLEKFCRVFSARAFYSCVAGRLGHSECAPQRYLETMTLVLKSRDEISFPILYYVNSIGMLAF